MSHIVNDLISSKVDDDIQISNSDDHICMLKDGAIQCEKMREVVYLRSSPQSVPELKNPIDISVGSNTACAIDDTGIVCWGFQPAITEYIPKTFKNPVAVSVGSSTACAIDSLGITCWGYLDGFSARGTPSNPPSSTFKSLSNPRTLSHGRFGDRTCVIDDMGVKCMRTRSFEEWEELNTPELVNPSFINVSTHTTCAIDRTGLNCWLGNGKYYTYDSTELKNFQNFKEYIPNLVNPTQVVGGMSGACALDSKGVHCWSYRGPYKSVPTLKKPSMLGDYYQVFQPVCVLDDDEVICWKNFHEESHFFPL